MPLGQFTDVPLPTFPELAHLLREIITVLWQGNRASVNLTNEVNDQFISRARNSAVVYSVTGREYMFGVRVAFP